MSGGKGSRLIESIIALLDEALIITILLIAGLYYLYSRSYLNLQQLLLIILIYIIILFFIFYKIYLAQVKRAEVGPESLIGRQGLVIEDLSPEGYIEVEGELWKAIAKDEAGISKGEKVVVISYKGLTLIVTRKGKDNEM